MKPATISLLKDLLLFSLLLFGVYLLNMTLMDMLNTHTSWESDSERGTRLLVYYLVCATLLFWFLNRRKKDNHQIGYWKLLFFAALLFFIRYHFTFLFEVLDYYYIHPITRTDSLSLQIAESLKPAYNPIREFIGSVTALIYLPVYRYFFFDVIIGFIFGSFMLPLWMPALVIFRFKRKNNLKNQESTFNNE